MRSHGPIAVALVLAILAVYAPVRQHAFVDYDDPVVLLKTQPGLGAEGLEVAVSDTIVSNWIPVSTLSWLTGQSLFGDAPGPRLLINVALHAGATLALYAAGVVATGLAAPSAFAAGVFALHPVHVESVAWFSQRKDVLCALFWFLALAIHLGGDDTPRRGRRCAVWALGVLALLSKPTAVTLPFTLVLADLWPARRIPLRDGRPALAQLGRSIAGQTPLFLAAAAISIVTYQVQDQTGAVAAASALPWPLRLTNASLAVGAYLTDVAWPRDLAVFYPHPGRAASVAAALGIGVGLAAALAWTATQLARKPWGFVGLCWFLGTLVPMLGLVQVGEQARADRYLYVPLVGLAWAIAFGVADRIGNRKTLQRAAIGVGLAVLGALAFAARGQVETWQSSKTLYAQAVAATGPNAFAERGLGRALRREGKPDAALPHLREAVRLRPRHAASRVELGELLAERGEREAALDQYGIALELAPDDLRSRVNRGRLLLREQRLEEAQRELEQAASRAQRGQPLALAYRRPLHLGLAQLHAARGRTADSEAQLQIARELDPNHPLPWIVGGELAWQRGDRTAAAARWRTAADRAEAQANADLARQLRARAAQAEAAGSSSRMDSSPGTPTRKGKP